MRKKAIYPGSFDPLTNGHIDIVKRSLKIFDEITLVVASSTRKTALIDPTTRVQIIKEVFKSNPRVKVDRWDGLTMDYAKKNRVDAIVRGLRAASDFEYEFMMAETNKQLYSKVETMFLMTGQNLFFISSSMVKELFRFGGDISAYVPKVVLKALKKTS